MKLAQCEHILIQTKWLSIQDGFLAGTLDEMTSLWYDFVDNKLIGWWKRILIRVVWQSHWPSTTKSDRFVFPCKDHLKADQEPSLVGERQQVASEMGQSTSCRKWCSRQSLTRCATKRYRSLTETLRSSMKRNSARDRWPEVGLFQMILKHFFIKFYSPGFSACAGKLKIERTKVSI